jgi:hypothetical protein
MSMTAVDPWPVNWAACPAACEQSPAATGLAVKAASQILGWLTGGQFGTNAVTMRPCRRDCFPGVGWFRPLWPGEVGWPHPALVDGAWINLGCGSCGPSCGCGRLEEAVLPGPVYELDAVRVDGVVLPTSAYRLDRDPSAAGDLLVRVDGGAWPRCQDLAADHTQPGTWAVTARYGVPVPEAGQLAVGEFACEWFKAMDGQACGLPAQVTSLARQGVTISLEDPTQVVEKGLLGLPLCDWFIRATNPHGLLAPPRVLSPDTLPPRRSGV